jgi:hypothetical protein
MSSERYKARGGQQINKQAVDALKPKWSGGNGPQIHSERQEIGHQSPEQRAPDSGRQDSDPTEHCVLHKLCFINCFSDNKAVT